MSDTDAIERLTNLTFALLGAERPRDYAWVYKHVSGYAPRSDETFQRLLSRDMQTIRRAGVPARMEGGLVWINKDAYELPAVEFTDEEATVLGLAGDLGTRGGLGAFARSGWTKLAASGATRAFDAPALGSVDNDVMRLDAEVVRLVTACVRGRVCMSFDYQSAPTAEVQRRTMAPWGIVALNNRAYVVGFDNDRGEPRAFRAVRVRNVKRTEGVYREADRPLQEIVEDILRGPVADARVSVDDAPELEALGTREGGDLVFTAVERDWLVRTIASYAPRVRAISPADVKEDVVKLLEAADEG